MTQGTNMIVGSRPKRLNYGDLPEKLHSAMDRIMRLTQPAHTNAVDDLAQEIIWIAEYWEANHD